MTTDALTVEFRVRLLERQAVDASAVVFVVGSAPELGAWDVEQAGW